MVSLVTFMASLYNFFNKEKMKNKKRILFRVFLILIAVFGAYFLCLTIIYRNPLTAIRALSCFPTERLFDIPPFNGYACFPMNLKNGETCSFPVQCKSKDCYVSPKDIFPQDMTPTGVCQ